MTAARSAMRMSIVGVFALTSSCGAPIASHTTPGVITHSAPIVALLHGVYEDTTTVATLKRRGDVGRGGFSRMDGEMVVLDGRVYQATVDGLVREVPDTMRTPFYAVAFLRPDRVLDIGARRRSRLGAAAIRSLTDDYPSLGGGATTRRAPRGSVLRGARLFRVGTLRFQQTPAA